MSEAVLHRELDHLILRLKGLVLVRALLERRGASAAELAIHSAEIARVRADVAQLVKESCDAATFDESSSFGSDLAHVAAA